MSLLTIKVNTVKCFTVFAVTKILTVPYIEVIRHKVKNRNGLVPICYLSPKLRSSSSFYTYMALFNGMDNLNVRLFS